MKSNLNLQIEITHDEDIPSAQDLSEVVAKAIAKAVGNESPVSFSFGRVTLVGAEDQDAVRVFLQSAAITSGGSLHIDVR